MAVQPEAEWQRAARERGCYCDVWNKDPAAYEKLGYAAGFCGICERCSAPGHTRHFPGPVPYTGSWCDRCYRILAWTWPFRSLTGWFFVLCALAIAAYVVRVAVRILG
jgi:hypothetical protein